MSEWGGIDWGELRARLGRHPGKVTGAAAGFVFGLLVMWTGVLWALFIGGTTLLGYWVGARLDVDGQDVPDWVERLMWTIRR